MKKIFLLFFVSLAINLMGQDNVSLIREKLKECDESGVMVVAHRGGWRNYPENSLDAIDYAIKIGVDMVEVDIQRTSDGHLILMHDHTLDRTTTGSGIIAEKTLAYIKTLNLKDHKGNITKCKVPTLEEVLLHSKDKIILNLDKADRYFDQIYELLLKTKTSKQILMKGGESVDKVRAKFGKYLDKVIYMPVVNLDKENAEKQVAEFIDDLSPKAFEFIYKDDTNTLPLKLKKKLSGRSLIWYNTLWDSLVAGHDDQTSLTDIDNGYGYVIDVLGARIIQTDRPLFLLDYLRSRNLHK